MRVRITWGHITEGALIDFLKQGFFLQKTPFRPNSLWLRNPKYYPRDHQRSFRDIVDDVTLITTHTSEMSKLETSLISR